MTTSVEAQDDLLSGLRDELRAMTIEALDDPAYDWADRAPDPADRAEKRSEVVRRVNESADEILQNTTEKITALRGAHKRVADHESQPEGPTGPDELDRTGHAMVGVALWPGVITPLLYWQFGQGGLSGGTLFGVRSALLLATVVSLVWSRRLVARAGMRFTGKTAFGGVGWPFVAAVPTIYGLLLWRLWTPSVWAAVGWVGAAVLALLLVGVAYGMTNTPGTKEEEGRRLPTVVVHRVFATGFGGLVATFTVLVTLVSLGVPPWRAFLVSDLFSLLWFGFLGPRSTIPAALSKNPDRQGSPEWRRTLLALRDAVELADRAWRAEALRWTKDLVTEHFNKVVEPTFSTTLGSVDPRSLGQMHDADRAVMSLAAGDRLRFVVAGLRSGAIGIAGPRGAGKSTLLDAYRRGAFGTKSRSHIAVLESVPVRYDAREFVLHLFTRTSQAVIDFCTQRGAGPDRPRRSVDRRELLRRAAQVFAVLVGWLAVGVVGSLFTRGVRFDADAWWPLVGTLAAVSVFYLVVRTRLAALPAHDETPPQAPPGDLSALRERARWELDRIRYQQKHVAGWSGKVGVQLGAEATVTGSREVTRQPLSYPEIVHEFSEFLRTTIGCVSAYPDIEPLALVIILDELDKIVDAEAAQDFLNEVKALFALDVPGFLFLVSVSEDALAAFERRGMPVRDAFDSAFDVIFRVEYLKLGDSRKVLSRRVVGMPDPFVCLCHCLAGGLPRELIRVGRLVIADAASLDATARRVVADDLASKRAGLRAVAARGNHDEVAVGDLVRHVDAHAIADAAVLLDAVRNPPAGEAVHGLQAETLGYLYFLATVLEVFGPEFTETAWHNGEVDGDGSFDTLASVRQLFAVNARLAWLTTSAFRKAWNLPEVPPPYEPHQNP